MKQLPEKFQWNYRIHFPLLLDNTTPFFFADFLCEVSIRPFDNDIDSLMFDLKVNV